MRPRSFLLPLVLAAAAAGGFMLQRHFQPAPAPAPAADPAGTDARPGAPAADTGVLGIPRPAFTLPDMSGEERHVSEWDGRVLAVNFWASWCLPCLKEIPELVELQSHYGASGLQVVGIALQDPAELEGFIREKKMNYPVLAGMAPVIAVAEAYGNRAGVLPYTAIVDRSGHIVFVKAGPRTGAEVEALIAPLL